MGNFDLVHSIVIAKQENECTLQQSLKNDFQLLKVYIIHELKLKTFLQGMANLEDFQVTKEHFWRN